MLDVYEQVWKDTQKVTTALAEYYAPAVNIVATRHGLSGQWAPLRHAYLHDAEPVPLAAEHMRPYYPALNMDMVAEGLTQLAEQGWLVAVPNDAGYRLSEAGRVAMRELLMRRRWSVARSALPLPCRRPPSRRIPSAAASSTRRSA